MKKGSREFFEVFRRGPQQEKPATWWLKRTAPPAAAGSGPAAEKAAAPSVSHGTGPGSNRVALSLSHEAVVVLVVVLAGMLIGAFMWGYSSGVAKQMAVASAPAPANTVAGQKPAALNGNGAATEPMKPPYFTISVMGAGALPMNAQRAKDLVEILRGAGISDAFVLGKGSSCSVNAGHFADRNSAEAKALKEKVDSLVIRDRRWFISCSWRKVTVQEH